MPSNPVLLDVSDVAEAFGVHPQTIRRWIRGTPNREALPAEKAGVSYPRWIIDADVLLRWLHDQREPIPGALLDLIEARQE